MTKQWLVKVTYPNGTEQLLHTRAGRPHTAIINAVYHGMDVLLSQHVDRAGNTIKTYDANRDKVWPLVTGLRIEFIGKDPESSPKPKSIQQMIKEEREAAATVPDFTPIFGANTN